MTEKQGDDREVQRRLMNLKLLVTLGAPRALPTAHTLAGRGTGGELNFRPFASLSPSFGIPSGKDGATGMKAPSEKVFLMNLFICFSCVLLYPRLLVA